MKKGIAIGLVLMISLLTAGCADEEMSKATVVEELPIEWVEEDGESKASEDVADNSAQVVQDEKEPYEDLELEVNGDKGTIVVGTTGAPFTEILTQVKILLAQEGWDLQIIKYEEYQKLNEDVRNGTLDAHLFAHQMYMDSYNGVNQTTLTTVDAICYEVFGVYSKVNQDLTKLGSAAVVGIPKEDTAKARALLYMQDLGWIVLKENVGTTAILDDIVENTKNLEFVEYTQDTLESIINETDYCIIGADLAIVAGMTVEEDVLKKETGMGESSKLFASILVAKEEAVSDAKMQVLVKALKSDAVVDYMEETYKGAYAIMK